MTLVQFIVNFLRPYADMPEFTTCVMKALEELGHTVTGGSFYEEARPILPAIYDKIAINSCRIAGKEAHTMIVDDSTLPEDLQDVCDE